MTGSDSKGGGSVSQADLATLKQDMANEFAQLKSVLQKTMDDLVDATRRAVPGEGTNDAGGRGSPARRLHGRGPPSEPWLPWRRSARPADCRRAWRGRHARTSRRARRGPGGGVRIWRCPGGAGSPSASLGPAVGYLGALDGAGTTNAPTGQPGRLAVGTTCGQMGMLTSGWGQGTATAALWVMPEPPDRWAGPLRTLGTESATVLSWAVPESPVPPMNSQAGSPRPDRWAASPWALGGGVGYGGVLSGAGALGAPYGQSGGLAVGPGRGFGHGEDLGGTGAIGAPSVALGRAAHDGLEAPGVGRALLGDDGGAGDPSTTLVKQINKIVTAHALTSWPRRYRVFQARKEPWKKKAHLHRSK